MSYRQLSRSVVFAAAVAACAATAGAATLRVGLTRSAPDYTTVQAAINAAANGDTILIDPGTYMAGQGTMDIMGKQNLTIKGNGGRPVLDLSDTIDPVSHAFADAASVHHKGNVVIELNGTTSCSNLTFDTLEWIHAGQRPGDMDYNAACIRIDNCTGTIKLRNCVMRDGQEGILDTNVANCNLDIQNCVFHDLGDTRSGGGVTHNLYLGGNKATTNALTFKYNWSYNCHYGYCLKSRYAINYVMYNRLGDEMGLALVNSNGGTPANPVGSPVDIANGGLTYFIGNILQNVPTSQDGNCLKYGDEGVSAGYSAQFYGVYNTILGRRDAAVTAFNLQNNGSAPAYIANNFMVHDGSGNLVSGSMVNNAAMVNSNLGLYEHQGMNPPAMQRFMYDANGYDCGYASGAGNHGTPNTFDTWDILNVRPIDPNTFTNGAACSNTAAKMPLTGYQTLLGLALLPGSNPLALPATGIDGTSLLAISQYAPMPYTSLAGPTSELRAEGTTVGAYSLLPCVGCGPVCLPSIISLMPPYIYEGWTVYLEALFPDYCDTSNLIFQWCQTAGQPQTPAGWTTLNCSFTVPYKSLTRRTNELLTFQFVATDNGSPPMSSTPIAVSVTCYMSGDVDHDHAVILADLKLLVAAWNATPQSPNWNRAADLGGRADGCGDDAVNLADLKLLVASWNRSLQ